MKEYIAYGGEEFTVEWYYNEQGKSQALEYFNQLDEDRQDKTMALFILMGDRGEIRNKTKFRSEGDGVYAFKPKPDRFLCFFFSGKKVVVTNAFEKKQDKLPLEEKRKAKINKKDYEARIKLKEYYD